MHKRGSCCHAVSVRPSVRLSVTFVDHVKTNKHIFIFFTIGSPTILVFQYQTGGDIPTGTPIKGASNAGGSEKTRFLTNIRLRCIQVYSVSNRTSREL